MRQNIFVYLFVVVFPITRMKRTHLLKYERLFPQLRLNIYFRYEYERIY